MKNRLEGAAAEFIALCNAQTLAQLKYAKEVCNHMPKAQAQPILDRMKEQALKQGLTEAQINKALR